MQWFNAAPILRSALPAKDPAVLMLKRLSAPSSNGQATTRIVKGW